MSTGPVGDNATQSTTDIGSGKLEDCNTSSLGGEGAVVVAVVAGSEVNESEGDVEVSEDTSVVMEAVPNVSPEDERKGEGGEGEGEGGKGEGSEGEGEGGKGEGEGKLEEGRESDGEVVSDTTEREGGVVETIEVAAEEMSKNKTIEEREEEKEEDEMRVGEQSEPPLLQMTREVQPAIHNTMPVDQTLTQEEEPPPSLNEDHNAPENETVNSTLFISHEGSGETKTPQDVLIMNDTTIIEEVDKTTSSLGEKAPGPEQGNIVPVVVNCKLEEMNREPLAVEAQVPTPNSPQDKSTVAVLSTSDDGDDGAKGRSESDKFRLRLESVTECDEEHQNTVFEEQRESAITTATKINSIRLEHDGQCINEPASKETEDNGTDVLADEISMATAENQESQSCQTVTEESNKVLEENNIAKKPTPDPNSSLHREFNEGETPLVNVIIPKTNFLSSSSPRSSSQATTLNTLVKKRKKKVKRLQPQTSRPVMTPVIVQLAADSEAPPTTTTTNSEQQKRSILQLKKLAKKRKSKSRQPHSSNCDMKSQIGDSVASSTTDPLEPTAKKQKKVHFSGILEDRETVLKKRKGKKTGKRRK